MDREKMEKFIARKIGSFIWDAFCDPDGLGVSLRDVLDGAALAGVDLTEAQKEVVIRHMDDVDSWTPEDEAVRDKIADATDSEDFESMASWLAYVVGDCMAEAMLKEWEE